MKAIIVTVTGEVADDTPLNPGGFTARIESNDDTYFDVYGAKVLKFREVPSLAIAEIEES